MNLHKYLPFALLLFSPLTTNAFESGSSGADGAFNPTENTVLQIPESGVFNFTDVNIPAGVTVTFAKNAANTPVTLLASGDITIDGTINVNGNQGGALGNGAPGTGGPGGYNGGRGAAPDAANIYNRGGDGLGPGSGEGGGPCSCSGGGGGYGSNGSDFGSSHGSGGLSYGNVHLLPLIGGSGGGGAGVSSTSNSFGSGGGGGGGAILIAASGTISIEGTITARGGSAGSRTGTTVRAGNGSGGAIRIVATTIQGNGSINASALGNSTGIQGGHGRIRLEAEFLLRTNSTAPAYSFAPPGPIFVSNLPSIRITSVGGTAAPGVPSGDRDIILPGVTNNPVTIDLETSHVPLGTVISVKATPDRSLGAVSVDSSSVAGSEAAGTASASIDLPAGHSTLTAQATFSVTLMSASLGRDFSRYAQGEPVERVRVSVDPSGQSMTTFITASGREHTWPSNALLFSN